MKIPFLLVISIFVLQIAANGQTTVLFKGQKGEKLLTNIVKEYKTSTVLDYNNARDALWGAMAKRNNEKLEGVYTGFTVSVNSSASNPRTEAYKKGIDCEHTWPQSKGASSGNARSDMHHLFPTRREANSSRGSLPFNDIDDSKTDKWFKDDKILTSKPSSSIDAYSELDNSKAFEPREEHKGNVARAMFYFYTIYKSQANESFFLQQKEVLYKWHIEDPVDADEIWRNDFIATKQGGKKNPFILDSSLITRAYFPNWSSDVTFEVTPGNHIIYTGVDSIVEFEVNTNLKSWTTNTDDKWVNITSDFVNKKVKVSVSQNSSDQKRQAFISIKGDGANEQIVSIEQKGVGSTSLVHESDKLSQVFNVFPNPFDDKISFAFDVEKPSHVQILIFDSKGEVVRTHFNFYPEAGQYTFDFETSSLSTGYYYFNFIMNNAEKKGELILAR